jgi:hypothetical protein
VSGQTPVWASQKGSVEAAASVLVPVAEAEGTVSIATVAAMLTSGMINLVTLSSDRRTDGFGRPSVRRRAGVGPATGRSMSDSRRHNSDCPDGSACCRGDSNPTARRVPGVADGGTH